MARKNNEPPKIVALPKNKPKILFSEDYLEIARRAQEMALYARDVEICARAAKKAVEFSDVLCDDFITAKKLRDSAQKDFVKAIEKILANHIPIFIGGKPIQIDESGNVKGSRK